ncbi:putative mitochondrial protein [Tanacetum coccineum]
MIQSPVLALSNFEEVFVIETDALGIRIGAVLPQNNHLIAYRSKTFAPKHQSLSTYEKEILAVILALQKWRGYLLDRHFKIKTDHFSLKTDNTTADALSRVEGQGQLFSLLAGASNELMDAVIATWSTDLILKEIVEGLKNNTTNTSNSAIVGHSGVQATTKRLTTYFYWNGLRKMVKEWDISMDFIESLPLSLGKSALLVVVDTLSKFAHFLPITHPYTASQVAHLFLDTVYMLPGLPKTIVSNRDKVFMSLFWQSLFKMLQVKQKMSTAYHPHTDGQTKIVNKCFETYLRSMTGEKPKDRVKWISLVEYCAVEAVDRTLVAREQTLKLLQFNLKRAQDRMKSQANKRTSDREFQVAYKLQFLHYAKVHPVFHVSQLKPCYVEATTMGKFPQCDEEGLLATSPLKLLERKLVKQNNGMVIYGLIQWSNGDAEDATWEKLEEIISRFQDFLTLF